MENLEQLKARGFDLQMNIAVRNEQNAKDLQELNNLVALIQKIEAEQPKAQSAEKI